MRIGCAICGSGFVKKEAFRQKRNYYEKHPDEVWAIFNEGSTRAREVARKTMEEVRQVLGLTFAAGK